MNIKELLTMPTYLIISLTVASGILVFAPEWIISKFSMTTFKTEYGFWIGLIFIVCVSIISILFLIGLGKILLRIIYNRMMFAQAEKRLKRLNEYQRYIVYAMYSKENFTLDLPVNDGAVNELVSLNVIGRSGSLFLIDPSNPHFSFHLQPWALQELKKNSELLSTFKASFDEKYKQEQERRGSIFNPLDW
ncbi:superinfection exclusion B family protein (plasmid) [Bacillus pumilus]|uniref:superinfection exclusion B family protein n=1 Tax=Bacillus pumilus TaxID=1408 RepID=UPI001657ED8C|nr:superinfection exclusion B family protein [Bacillus pumilus]QNP18278.1 superinfection exclusion B family protein [Bacillus pumilus]